MTSQTPSTANPQGQQPLPACVGQHLPAADEGYMLLAVLLMVFLILLALSVAAPRVAMQLKHDQEIETQHRANQYVRAIRVYYRKFGHYPGSLAQLEKSNNQRFLRQHYIDPLTGKEDWKPILVGQNKTKVKGFFGEDLPGIGGGLGAAGGLASPSSGGSAFNNTLGTPGGGAGNGANGGNGITGGNGSAGGSAPTGTPPGQAGSGNGIGEQNATDYSGGGGGPFMGVGTGKSGEAFLTVNGVSTYQEWEFIYDPRIEQLYAKANLLGGGGTMGGSPSGGGLGTSPGSGTPPAFGTPPGGTPAPPVSTPTPAPQ